MKSSNGLPGGTRTPDLLLRRQLLYPVELLAVMRWVKKVQPASASGLLV